MHRIKLFIFIFILPLLSADLFAYSSKTILFFDDSNVFSSYTRAEHNKKLILSVSSDKDLMSLNSGYGFKGFSPVRYSLYVMPGLSASSDIYSINMLVDSYVYINPVYSLEAEYRYDKLVASPKNNPFSNNKFKLAIRADWFGVTFDSIIGLWMDEGSKSSGVYLGLRL